MMSKLILDNTPGSIMISDWTEAPLISFHDNITLDGIGNTDNLILKELKAEINEQLNTRRKGNTFSN
jgi:hypothetical protein